MPEETEEDNQIEDRFLHDGPYAISLDTIVMDDMEKGRILTSMPGMREEQEEIIQYDVLHLRNFVKELYQLYATKPSKKELVKLLEKHRKRKDDDLHNFMSKIENVKEHDQFEVIDKKNKGDEVIIRLKKLDNSKKDKYVKSIVTKLIKKIKPEQLQGLFEQSLKKINSIKDLKKVDKALDTENPKIEGKRGCYKFVVNDVDIFIIG